jgi:hypothetical protein
VTSRSSDAEYFQAVEEAFVARRGEPLVLSNADWFLAWKWRRQGIPLRVVLRGIDDALDAHEHSWSRDRKVASLAYCAGEVEAATDRWHRAVGAGREEPTSAPELLEGMAVALAGANPLGPQSAELLPELAGRLRHRARRAERGASLDRWLGTQEEQLVAALLSDMGPEGAAALRASVEEGLDRYRRRLPQRVLDQVVREGLARRALEAAGLPRLSLFQDDA